MATSHQVNRRDQVLSAYRQACFVQHGLHVIDKNQIVADPVLSDGAPMTMEIRQAIAAARAQIGKAYSAKAHAAGKLDYINDAELDGILPKQDWERSFKYVESTLGPPRIVRPQELPTPAGELQLRLNQEFLELIKSNVSAAETMSQEFLDAWVRLNSRRMVWWAPEVKEPSWFETYGRFKFPDAAPPRTISVSRTVDFTRLAASGQTFRGWFQQRLAQALADLLDGEFHNAISKHIRLGGISSPEGLLRGPRADKFQVWLLDPAALVHLGALPDQCIVPRERGVQFLWDRPVYPMRERFAFAREVEAFQDAAMHIEPADPYRVEITPSTDPNGEPTVAAFTVTVSYTGSIHLPDPAAQFCWLAYL